MEHFLEEPYRTRDEKYNVWNEKYTEWDYSKLDTPKKEINLKI